ncbi:zinc-dependent alcohol dehydrogenase family protein [Sphingorhabdus sp. SMR4y]|uniref:zinc-dependent alcohol dehydrogenase family protein n=1 Tax=Sphingorhabdus sp. SMR4y TaxID=2584094 RepID=UPI000B5CE289|nr:NAD(P)-dependent alcohol dehydrogenase [Sphingorhabdus sp. SMR4y]ASK88861.1 phthiocerol synthesis polyketide synthase type I PpsC [Sphingorhabdus sp. SMR4y]
MKVWEIGARTGIDGLRMTERDQPTAGAGELLVKVTASGLNFRDLMVLSGNYGENLPEGRIPLSDGVGVVEAIGEGVAGFAVGDRVTAPHFLNWLDGPYNFGIFGTDLGVTADGWLAEKITLPASAAIVLPDAVDDQTAASLSVVAGTVWHAMVAFGAVKPGELVLAQGTGGVSIFALQLAKALGADFAISSSSDDKLARAQEMGADYVVNYRDRPDWASALLEKTGGRGADVVVDTLGFPALGETVAATAVNGRIGTLGALSGSPQATASASQGAIIGKNITIKGIASGSRAMTADAIAVVAEHGISNPVDKQFSFADAPAAYRYLESGSHFGKILIRPDEMPVS